MMHYTILRVIPGYGEIADVEGCCNVNTIRDALDILISHKKKDTVFYIQMENENEMEIFTFPTWNYGGEQDGDIIPKYDKDDWVLHEECFLIVKITHLTMKKD